MQIRCSNCHRPFALGKEAVHTALDQIAAENLNHYSVNCPHCRRANRISPKELRRAAPGWQPEGSSEPSAEESESESA